jgi:hypothetical protein
MEAAPFIVNKIGKIFIHLPIIIAHAHYYSQSIYWIMVNETPWLRR